MEYLFLLICWIVIVYMFYHFFASIKRDRDREYRILKKVSERAEKVLNTTELNRYKYYNLASMKMGTSAILFDFDNRCIETFYQPYKVASDKNVGYETHYIKTSDILQIEIKDGKRRTIASHEVSDAVTGYMIGGVIGSAMTTMFGEWWHKKAHESQACLGLYIQITTNNVDKPLIRFPLTPASSFYKIDNQTAERVIEEILASFHQILEVDHVKIKS